MTADKVSFVQLPPDTQVGSSAVQTRLWQRTFLSVALASVIVSSPLLKVKVFCSGSVNSLHDDHLHLSARVKDG